MNHSKIGIGITEHNRPEIFSRCYEQIKKYSPDADIAVVDDASAIPVENATYRFEKNVGIAKAKNKCLELLDDLECEHIFLFDSDIWPKKHEWWKPYIEADQDHLMYIYQDSLYSKAEALSTHNGITSYSHARGAMLYITRDLLHKAGGMNPMFGKWGYEHKDWSKRIHNMGYTRNPFQDINSKGLFHSLDEIEGDTDKHSTVPRAEQRHYMKTLGVRYRLSSESKKRYPYR